MDQAEQLQALLAPPVIVPVSLRRFFFSTHDFVHLEPFTLRQLYAVYAPLIDLHASGEHAVVEHPQSVAYLLMVATGWPVSKLRRLTDASVQSLVAAICAVNAPLMAAMVQEKPEKKPKGRKVGGWVVSEEQPAKEEGSGDIGDLIAYLAQQMPVEAVLDLPVPRALALYERMQRLDARVGLAVREVSFIDASIATAADPASKKRHAAALAQASKRL